jgi:transcriptional regulator with XRE-family HTH domain
MRIDLGRGMRDLAADVCITPSYLSRIETGSRRVSPALFRALRVSLGATRDELLLASNEDRAEVTTDDRQPEHPAV